MWSVENRNQLFAATVKCMGNAISQTIFHLNTGLALSDDLYWSLQNNTQGPYLCSLMKTSVYRS